LVYEVFREKGCNPCRPLGQRLDELKDFISDGANIPEGSLRLAALHFQKDSRTIRRWCVAGVFPTATRSKGGHWRIPFDDIFQVRTPANSRLPKTTLGLRARKRFLAGPVKLLLLFHSVVRALSTVNGTLNREQQNNVFQTLRAHLEPGSSSGRGVLSNKIGKMWVQAEFERLQEKLRASSWQEPPNGEQSASRQRKARGFGLTEVAENAGVHRTTLYRWRKAEPWLDKLLRDLKTRVRRDAIVPEACDPDTLAERGASAPKA
jgi:hypothetical protein